MDKVVSSITERAGSLLISVEPLVLGIIGALSIEHLLPLSMRLYYSIGFIPLVVCMSLVFFSARWGKNQSELYFGM